MDAHAVAAIDNLKKTYLSIGLATTGAKKIEQEGCVICVSGHDHPVGNFAVVDFCDDLGAKDLALYAGAKETFHLYVSPDAAQNGTAVALTKRGFRSVHTLQAMWVEGLEDTQPDLIELVQKDELRSSIAHYMADQFFGRRGGDIARSVAEATLHSGLDLYEIRVGHDRVGVVMLTDEEKSIGIYNLVVAPNLRKRGYGARTLREIRKKAQLSKKAVTLQCEKSLSAWYRGNDFASCGEISVYVLERR
ncbi:MAG: hypothetical protein KF784_04250 [Fimbriimonadaceae bacterium]|nr:hypothetical protein [Fimbriimonadaceae bacterium]